MASPNANNVSVGKPKAAGGIFAAPIGTTAPVDALAVLAGTYKGLGYVSDSGLVNSISVDSSDITAWGGDNVLTVNTSRAETFTFTFIETNADVLTEVYGPSNVSADGDGNLTVLHNAKELPARVYVFEILLTGNRVKRIVVENARISEIGDVSYVDGEPIGYEVTLAARKNAAGDTAVEYIAEIVDDGE